MTNEELTCELRRLSTVITHAPDKSDFCFCCGYEHSCRSQGCAILRAAAELLAEKSPWIRAADPPAIGNLVIVRMPSGMVASGFLHADGWWRVGGDRTKRVAHWMPMPATNTGGD